MVGLDTLQFRREATHIINYCLIPASKVNSPSVQESIHFYVRGQYMRGVGRRQSAYVALTPG